jgi:acetyl esterase/lipase
MPIVVGIDGTGPFFDSTYETNFRNSFVRRICPERNANKRYFRGPIGPGGGMPQAIDGGYNFIIARRGAAGADNSILLTGFSRGGLGVLVIAERLRRQNIPVKAMLLFDAVDRHVAYNAPRVPDNVANVFHARRNWSGGSRESFGNCGTEWNQQKTKYTEQFFRCTHGGVGGTPWEHDGNPNAYIDEGFPDGMTRVTFAEDVRISAQVWTAVQPFLREHRFV